MKFDFLFLDTVHLAPGELINIIEALPFLNDEAIVVLHVMACAEGRHALAWRKFTASEEIAWATRTLP